MDKKPILSIVVPTKDRYFYLKKLIELIDSFSFGDEVEMVIQDNTADNTDIKSFLAERNYNFVIYDHHSKQLPVSLNSDKAVLNSSGEYICFIGDDDGVTRYILDGVKWMKANEIDVAKPAEVHYLWPDAKEAVNVTEGAVVNYKKFTGKVNYVSPLTELQKSLREGFPDRGDMPLVYHGIASREILNEIYDRCGTYFPGNSPDIANAVALSLTAKKYAIVDLPWAIYGSCMSKGGGERLPGRKFPPAISDIPHWAPEAEKRWHPKIPKVAIWVTIWPESAICALKQMGREELISEFNFTKFYARFLFFYPQLRSYVEEMNISKFKIKMEYCNMILLKYIKAIFRRVGWGFGINKPHKVKNINTINEAAALLETISDGAIMH